MYAIKCICAHLIMKFNINKIICKTPLIYILTREIISMRRDNLFSIKILNACYKVHLTVSMFECL